MAVASPPPGSALDEGGPIASAPWEPPSHRAPSHRRRNFTLVMVAVAVVVLLAVTGSLPGIPGLFPTKHTPTNGLSFDRARAIADSMAKNISVSAKLDEATGIANNRTYIAALENLTGSSCPLSGGNTSRFVDPAMEGDLTQGLAPAWVFQYTPGPHEVFYVGVINGSAVYYGEVANASCYGVDPAPNLPSALVDSRQIAATAAPQAVDFARNYSISLGLYRIIQQLYPGGQPVPKWNLEYTSCSLGAATGMGHELYAVFDATTGAVQGGNPNGFFTSGINCSMQTGFPF